MYKITEKGSRVLKNELTTTYPTDWVFLLELLDGNEDIGEEAGHLKYKSALKEMDEIGLVRNVR